MGNRVHEAWKEIRDEVLRSQRETGVTEPVEAVKAPNEELGHLGFPAFSLARQLRRNPNDIAAELAGRIRTGGILRSVTTAKGYVNLFLDEERLANTVLAEIFESQERFAAGGAAVPGTWLVEYSSPNTNKPLHLGHIRNNLLGMGVSRLAEYYGHNVVKVNLVNDRGIHICKTMLAYGKWGAGSTPQSAGVKGDHFVGEFYVRFDREFRKELAAYAEATGTRPEEDGFFNGPSNLGREARDLLLKWEQGDPQTLSLWKRMNEWVLDGFRKTYERMGCRFDLTQFESDTWRFGRQLVEEGVEKGVFSQREDGAVVLDVARIDPALSGEKVLLRSDGTSVYMTQDIGTAARRVDQFFPDRLIYVVGDEQNYHFKLLFGILDLLRPGTGQRCHHLAYGMVRLPEGRMKSREGTVVDADDLMDELHALAREEVLTRAREGHAHAGGVDDRELGERSERIAQAALKFFVFRFTPKKSFEYDPKQSIDFAGQTGPYCLYAYARTRSLVRKSGTEPRFDATLVPLLALPSERVLVRQLFELPLVVEKSAETLDPSKIAEYAFNLAASFARMFNDRDYPIVTCEDARLRSARVMLAAAVGITLKTALGLLGIDVLEEM